MKVAYILDSFPNISETFISDEIYSVLQAGVDCHVFSLKTGRSASIHPRAQYILDSKRVTYQQLPFFIRDINALIYLFLNNPLTTTDAIFQVMKTGQTRWIARSALTIAKDVVRRGCTHIHAHFADQAAQIAMWVHRWTGIPFSFTTHGYDIFEDPPSNMAELVSEAQAMVCISRFNKNYLISNFDLDEKKLSIVHCGIYASDFEDNIRAPDSIASRIKLLCVARLAPEKGHKYLFEAISLLRTKGIDVELWLAGDGSLRKELEVEVAKLEITPYVSFLGAQTSPEVRQLFHECDISVLASISESMGLVNMEGMISGRPVIATDVLGVSELVEHHVTGFLCSPRDPDCIAKTVEWILTHPQETKKIIDAGKKHVKAEFIRELCTEKLLTLWRGSYGL